MSLHSTPDYTPLEPSGLVVRYADRSKGWGEAMDCIDAVLEADRQWWAEQTPDGAGLTDREEERLAIEMFTISALDRLLETIPRDPS